MRDMSPNDVAAPARELVMQYHDGHHRRLLLTEIETPFPAGELIVSQSDPEGNITFCNDAFVHMSGYPRDELMGAPHHILRHPDMPGGVFRVLWETISRQEKWHGYVKNLRRDGGFYWVFATIVPNLRGGRLVGYTSVRRQPGRTQVLEAAASYERLLAEERRAQAPASGA